MASRTFQVQLAEDSRYACCVTATNMQSAILGYDRKAGGGEGGDFLGYVE